MGNIRQPAVAGLFYPSDAQQLHEDVQDYLHDAEQNQTTQITPKAIIAPHAGYMYSGPVAATAYAQLRPLKGQVSRVILLGPTHRVPFRGLACSSAEAFATPMGNIRLDLAAIDDISRFPQVKIFDEAHVMEHSLEVHLPFLQETLGDFQLVPLVVGDASGAEVAEVLQHLWGGPETLIVISSDLSHYHDYHAARQLDKATSDDIIQLNERHIHSGNACGFIPVRGLIHLAKKRGLNAQLLDLRNSGDTSGSKDRVVGYGAYAFH